MKKAMLVFLLMTVLLPVKANAEVLYYGADDAALVSDLEPVSEFPSRAEAMSAALEDDTGAALITQQDLIESVQGYTDWDVSSDLSLVKVLAQSDLYLVCSADTAKDTGVFNLPSLTEYLKTHEYGLQIMRSFQATNTDYASVLMLDELMLDEEMFVDEADKWSSIENGDYILVADTAKAVELEKEGKVVLGALTEERTAEYPDLPCAGECGLPAIDGTLFVLATKKDANGKTWAELSLTEDVLTEEHLHQPNEKLSIEEAMENYVNYMTEEGLFFY